jgi:NAD(P) transhydrogenase subunit alpha
VISNGVIIIGNENLPASVATHASQVYANNLYNMIEEFWDKENKIMNIDINDEILSGCVISHSGESIDPLSK